MQKTHRSDKTELRTDMAVDGVFFVQAGALIEVFDWDTVGALRAWLTHARVVTVIDVDRADRFTDHVDQLPVDTQL